MTGLTDEQVNARIAEGKVNADENPNTRTYKQIVRENTLTFFNFLNLVLLVLVLLVGSYKNAFFVCIIIINTLIGIAQEIRAKKTIDKLAILTARKSVVIREGQKWTVPTEELVLDDVVCLKTGDQVPADARILEGGLEVNESLLTGESDNLPKNEGDELFSGSFVTSGEACCQIIHVGKDNYAAQITSEAKEFKRHNSELKNSLNAILKVISIIIVPLGALLFYKQYYIVGDTFRDSVVSMVAGVLGMIPEGLVLLTSVALTLGALVLANKKTLVQELYCIETLARVDTLCLDKTGTITENRMTVTAIVAGGERFSVTGTGLQKAGAIQLDGSNINPLSKPALRELLTCGSLCSTAEIHSPQEKQSRNRGSRTEKGTWSATGDPTETALLIAAEKGGISRKALLRTHPVQHMEPFDSETRRMAVTVTDGAGTCTYWKGAADVILPLCGFQMQDGKSVPLSESARAAVRKQVAAMSDEALRVLAFAKQEGSACIFLGLAGMLDPPRESARTAIRTCAKANIRTVMITGDHKNTAAAIARQAGLLRGKKAMTGAELDTLTDAQLDRCIDQYSVFARVNPAHKLRLVRAYKRRGEIVAMTGDGVNDAPAIKEADVGVAMGKSGTDVARQAADVVLTDDNLATLVDAVEQGRCVYANIRKFVRYLLSCNIGEVLTMFLGILMGMPVVLLPTQLLLVNLVTDGPPAIALGLEPPEPEAMQKPPRRPDESFFSDGLMGRIFFRGMLIGICTLGAFSAVVRTGGTLEAARTAALCTLILSQLVHVFECKSERRTLFSMPYGNNLWLVGAVLVSVAVLAAAVAVPMLRVIFSTVMLTHSQWYIALGFSLTVPLCSSIAGLFRRKKRD